MSAVVEFQTQVQDGVIMIPEQYKDSFAQAKDVRVILIQQVEQVSSEPNFLQMLLDHPVVVEDFVPLTRDEIYER